MLLARAFVLSLNARGGLAVCIVALSVAYALVTGFAASGLREAGDILAPDLLEPSTIYVMPGLRPFRADIAPAGAAFLIHASWHDAVLGTQRPWPYGAEVVPGPYAGTLQGDELRALGLPVSRPREHAHAPGNWVLVPPAEFDGRFPELHGLATMAVAETGAPAGPLLALPVPGVAMFYETGARQVVDSIHFVVAAMGIVVAVLAGGVLRLEVLAREQDLATLEAIGGARAAGRLVVFRGLYLVGLGVGLGVGTGLVAAKLAGRALGGLGLSVDPLLAVETAAVALLAGGLAGALGGLSRLRSPLRTRLGKQRGASRPFPGPLRFLLVTPRLVPSVMAAALVLASIASVIVAAANVPATMFSPPDAGMVLGQTTGNPLRGSADRFFGEHATVFDGVNASSPEIVVPTIVRERPVVVRGVNLAGWRAYDQPHLESGAWPKEPEQATAGTRLARLLAIRPGDELLVPGAYRATVRQVHVVGIHGGAGLLDDELLTDLDTAGDLAALPPHEVHLVRIRGDPVAIRAGVPQTIVVVNLTVRPTTPVPLTEAIAHIDLMNFGAAERSRALGLTVNGVLSGSALATVPGHATTKVSIPFVVPAAPFLDVQVNPRTNVTTEAPGLLVVGPETIERNGAFTLQVLDPEGKPLPGAVVALEGREMTADAEGVVGFPAGEPRRFVATARAGELEGGFVGFVVDPAWALSPRLQGERGLVTTASAVNRTHASFGLTVTVTNLGGTVFEGTLEARAQNVTLGSVQARVEPRELATVSLDVAVPLDVTAVTVAGLEVLLPRVDSPSEVAAPEQRPRTVEQVLEARRQQLEQSGAERALSGRGFLEDVFANLEPAVVVVVLATFIHAAAGVAVAVLREVRERSGVLETLASLGATQEQIAALAAREALVAAVPGLALGAGAAIFALAWLEPYSFPGAFGHTITVAAGLDLFLRVVSALALVAAMTAVLAVRAPPELPPQQVPRRPLNELLGGP